MSRSQVGALPWRPGADGRIEVLLITTRGTGQWMIPKGGAMPGLGPAASAAEEAWEEAGVRGPIEDSEAGSFTHWKSRAGGPPVECRVAVHRLRVDREEPDYPERGQRKLRWLGIDEAVAAVRSPELGAIIAGLRALEG